MICNFDDSCWTSTDGAWNFELSQVLVLLSMRDQHTVAAASSPLLAWCQAHLPLYVDYFKTRLASSQWRANSLEIRISPLGADVVLGAPPWALSPKAAREIVNRPLRFVLENDQSDRLFVESTVPHFASWCQRGWIEPAMGGGGAMEGDIDRSSVDPLERWRTFYLFDSDRMHPSELGAGWSPPAGDSCQGHNFERICAAMPSNRWHRLKRRSIENYLPQPVLNAVDAHKTSVLFDSSIGAMQHFFNMKKGLRGDGIHPPDPARVQRAARAEAFWRALQVADLDALESGYGRHISEEFANVPVHHPWGSDILSEMNDLSAALQDAM